MKIILRRDVAKLGRAGEVREVKPGYARNYLIPQGLALKSTPGLLSWYQKTEATRQARTQARTTAAEELAQKLSSVSLSFSRNVGDKGQLFGSVGKSDILKSLKASGYPVAKDSVLLDAPIKSAGDFEVEVRLAPAVTAKIKVVVTSRQS